jgi:hypothetical protein
MSSLWHPPDKDSLLTHCTGVKGRRCVNSQVQLYLTDLKRQSGTLGSVTIGKMMYLRLSLTK